MTVVMKEWNAISNLQGFLLLILCMWICFESCYYSVMVSCKIIIHASGRIHSPTLTLAANCCSQLKSLTSLPSLFFLAINQFVLCCNGAQQDLYTRICRAAFQAILAILRITPNHQQIFLEPRLCWYIEKKGNMSRGRRFWDQPTVLGSSNILNSRLTDHSSRAWKSTASKLHSQSRIR